MKNEANLNSPNFTATSCSIGGYNVLRTKTQNGTKPNKANSKKGNPQTKSETQAKNFFMESKANFRNRKLPVFQNNKKIENEPNFNDSKVPQVTAIETLTTLCTQKETNPNEPNFPGTKNHKL